MPLLPLNILLALGYTVLGALCCALQVQHDTVTLVVFAPEGLALALVLLRGPRVLPGVLVGDLLLETWNGLAWPSALGIALGCTAEAWLGWFLLRRVLSFDPACERLRDFLQLVIAIIFILQPFSATIGTLVLATPGDTNWLAGIWLPWWTGNVLGQLLVTPLVLAWATRRYEDQPHTRRHLMTSLGITLVTVLFTALGFHWFRSLSPLLAQPELIFFIFLYVAVVSAIRGVRCGTTQTALLAVLAVVSTAQGFGPFVPGTGTDAHSSLLKLNIFLGALALVTGFIATLSAERRRVEAALTGSEQEHRELFDNASDLLLVIEVAPHTLAIRSANRLACEKLGRTREHLLTLGPADIAVPGCDIELEAKLRDCEAGHPITMDSILNDADGGRLPVELTARRIDHHGRPAVLCSFRDISLRHRAEQALRISEERLRLATRAAGIGVFDWDFATQAVRFDEYLDTLHGTKLSGTTNLFDRWLATMHPDDMPRARQTIQDALTGAPCDMHYRVVQPDGTTRHLLTRGIVQRDEHGIPLRLIGVIMDMSERVRLEDSLREAKELAEAATRAKAEFLAVMSHEIRTPLNGVLGLSSMLLDTTLTKEQRELLETLRTCSDSLLVLINDILDFSKIEAGKLDLESAEFGLRHTIDDAVALVSDRIIAHGLELATVIGPGVPEQARGDQTRLRQVLANLLSNAAKFTEHGSITVRLNVAEPEPSDQVEQMRLAISVIDTGIGITSEAQAHLFQVFSQAERSTTRRFGGTGLGLAICRLLVERMGGRIGVTSQPGIGTTFHFTVLLDRVADLKSDAPPGAAGTRVLVATAPPLIRATLVEQFQAWDMEVAQALPADAPGLLQAAKPPFRLIAVDCASTLANDLERVRTAARQTGTTLMCLCSRQEHTDADITLARPLRPLQLHRRLTELFTGTTPAPRTDRVTLRLSGTVLVAEDNPVNQRVALSLLEKLGLTVDLASDGNEAIAACSRRSYDLVLMDCRMPDKDGMEATTIIRRKESAAPRSRHLPIIALTAGVTTEERDACLAVGMDAVLHKPIRRENLVAILQRWLPSRPATPATDIRMAALESTSTGDPPLLDLDVFHRLRDETDDIDALFQLFVDERTVQIPALCTAVKDAPFDEVFTMAHRLKGAALTLGVRRFIARLLSIEQAATARNRIACIDACADLPILADSSIAAIARQL